MEFRFFIEKMVMEEVVRWLGSWSVVFGFGCWELLLFSCCFGRVFVWCWEIVICVFV